MVTRSLAALVAGQHAWRLVGRMPAMINDIQYDSRLVRPGSLFVALRGGYDDGHDFVPQAITNGAAAVMVEHELPLDVPQVIVPDSRAELATIAAHFYRFPSRDLHVIGITGTDGKTTTSYLVDHILRLAGRKTGMIGTVSVRIGDQAIDHDTRQTTPESADVQRLLRQMAEASVSDAILEATSHGLDLHRLDHTRFEVAAVTNITQEHLEHHKTREAYWRAKAILFARASDVGGTAVVNLDDIGARSVLTFAGGCRRILRYSLSDPSADLYAEIESTTLAGSAGSLHYAGARYPFRIPLAGTFNVANALAALGVAIARGVEIGVVLRALESVPPVPGRMASIKAGQPFGVIVDYAHTPESLEKVLRLLRELRPAGKVIVVFGSAGERDRVKRPIQGRVAIEFADVAVITNEDPRFEPPEAILEDIAAGALSAGGVEGETFHRVADRRAAIALAFALAEPGDTVLLAGKGHEQSIIQDGVKHAWDEPTVAREELARIVRP